MRRAPPKPVQALPRWPPTDGKLQARFLDAKEGVILAAFVVCESGDERLMSRSRGKTARCGHKNYPSFESARSAL